MSQNECLEFDAGNKENSVLHADSHCSIYEKYRELSISQINSGAGNFIFEIEFQYRVVSPCLNYILHVSKLSLRFSYRQGIQSHNSSRKAYAQPFVSEIHRSPHLCWKKCAQISTYETDKIPYMMKRIVQVGFHTWKTEFLFHTGISAPIFSPVK